MPAQGRGANLDVTRRIQPLRRTPAPSPGYGVLAPHPKAPPKSPAFSRALPQAPVGRATPRQQLHAPPIPQTRVLQEAQLMTSLPARIRLVHQLQREAAKQGVVGEAQVHVPKGSSAGASPTLFGSITLGNALATVAGDAAKLHVPVGGIPGKLLNEAIDIPGQTFLSSAIAGRAAREGIEGKPHAIAGIGQSVLDQLNPLNLPKNFEQAPLSTLLTAAGTEGGLGGLAGKLLRKGALGDVGRAFASTERPNLRLIGGLEKEQTYNPDPLRKQLQLLYEKSLTKLPEGRGRQLDPFQAEGARLARNYAGGGITKVGRVDRIVAGEEHTRRKVFLAGAKELGRILPEHGAEALSLIVQGIIRTPQTLAEDLTKEVNKLKAAQDTGELTRSELSKNKANLAQVEGLMHDENFHANPQPAFDVADEIIRRQKPYEAINVHGGKLHPDQLRAKLFPYVMAHIPGASYREGISERAMLAYSTREAAFAKATEAADKAQRDVERETRELTVLKERQAKNRVADMRGTKRGAVAFSKADVAQRTVRESKLEAAKGKLTAAQHDVKEAEQNRIVKPQPTFALRDAEGATLSNEAIKEHMAANGVKDVGFVSHREGVGGNKSFYKPLTRSVGTETFARTGSAFRKGTADYSLEHLAGSLAKQASDAAQIEGKARILGKLAFRPDKPPADERFTHMGTPEDPRAHGFESEAAAKRFASESMEHLPDATRVEQGAGGYVPVHLGPKPEGINAVELHNVLQQFGLHEYESAASKAAGKYGLIPKAGLERLQAHESALGVGSNSARLLQAYQQAFRRAKLNTSTRHIAGVIQEQGIRLGAEDVLFDPRARRAGRKVRESIERAAELDHNGHLVSDAGPMGARMREIEGLLGARGGQVGSLKDTDVTLAGRKFVGTSGATAIARGLDGAAHSTIGRKLLVPWHAWQHLIEHKLLTGVEHYTHDALFAKALKDSGFIKDFKSVLKAQDQAMHELVTTGLTPNKADYIASRVDDMMGNWAHQTPLVRKLVANIAPFGLWWLNSMRWLYRLPVTHPVKSAILAALYSATRKERAIEGQGFDAPNPVPAFLQGKIEATLPIVGKVGLQPSYYSPGGTLGPEYANTAAEQLFPQFQSVLAAAQGVNPLTHEPLRAGESRIGPVATAGNVLGAALTGPAAGATQLEYLLRGGGKPTGTSNIITELLEKLGGPSQAEPGTQRSLPEQLVKLLSPARFDFPSASGRGSSSEPSGRPARAAPGEALRLLHRAGGTRGGGGEALRRLHRR